jgi:hypothetical protein
MASAIAPFGFSGEKGEIDRGEVFMLHLPFEIPRPISY